MVKSSYLPISLQMVRSIWNWTPILMLHEILPDGIGALPPYAITQSQLRSIIVDFIERGYRSGTLDDVVTGQDPTINERGGTPGGRPGKKRLVLTFDDGTSDFMEYALPVLQELNFSATLFVVAGMVGGRRAWDGLEHHSDLAPVPLLSAADLRDLQVGGFTIGSHTISHRWLPSLGQEEAAREISVSRQMLEDLLGEPIRWFAYPYVAADQRSVALVHKAGYAGACGGSNRKHEQYYLNRIDASAFSPYELRKRCSGLYHLTRQAMRRVPSAASYIHYQVPTTEYRISPPPLA